MKARVVILAGMIIASAPSPIHAERPLKEYSFVRGVNHGMNGDQATWERDLGYAKRLNLNSTRIWFNYQGYERGPRGIYRSAEEVHPHLVSNGLFHDAYPVEWQRAQSRHS